MQTAAQIDTSTGPLAYIDFIHQSRWQDLPKSTREMAVTCVIDLLGVAASGTSTKLSGIIKQHALEQFASATPERSARLLFDGRRCSASGAALANGMTIDSVDAHDGYRPSKGHAGCGLLPGILALYDQYQSPDTPLSDILLTTVQGYELACRAGVALHASVPDYHTSGAWVAVAVSGVGSRIMGLSAQQTREAVGIAEYHGPRSQMMRCIDHPTMLKDGSGWGAMAGVSALLLAMNGFTGAPAITIEADDVSGYWQDLGSTWLIEEQYFKPFPVCRWAQPAVVASLALQKEHHFTVNDIAQLTIGSFHESVRLATREPQDTEQAQYSMPYPVAAALVHGTFGLGQIDESILFDEDVLALSRDIRLEEKDVYNAQFPARRISDVTITLKDGRHFESGPVEATGDPETPLSFDQLNDKFTTYTVPVIGHERTAAIAKLLRQCVDDDSATLGEFSELIYPAGN